jgi:membrane-associated phospholipid phosphatase
MSSVTPSFLPARWRVAPLLACHAAALALLASWTWPRTRAAWDALDAAVFHALNGSLAGSGAWPHAMALANMRAADALVALVMLAIVLRGRWIFARGEVRPALYALVAMLALLLAIRAGPFAEAVRALHLQRASPSLAIDGAIRLGQRFASWDRVIHIKDSSSRSFPGDHASVVFVWATFLGLRARARWRAIVVALSILFIMPRVVAGAHWASDVLVGGVAHALLTLSWGLCTPFAARASAWLERLFAPVVRRLGRLPLARRASLFEAR